MSKTKRDKEKWQLKAIKKGLRDAELDETRFDARHRFRVRVLKNKKRLEKRFDWKKDLQDA